MLEISQELIESLSSINKKIRDSYMDNIVNSEIRDSINSHVNNIVEISPMDDENLKKMLSNNFSIVGVDGSVNTIGLKFPHYISLMQALAKSTNCDDSVSLCDIHTPLIDTSYLDNNPKNLPFEVFDDRLRSDKMALLELQAAFESIDKLKPKIIFMDGSLTRYYNASNSKWNEFINKACLNKIIVVGIIEEIRTAELCSRLNIDSISNMYDRDILFGLLNQNEMFILSDWDVNGINKCFMRSSKDPNVIGVDFMSFDKEHLSDVLGLILSLTPYDGRGIPLWLDIVDNEVKLTDGMAKALIENYIDKDIVEKLIKPKRENRKL